MDLYGYWEATLNQEANVMRQFFHKDAYINWHNTNEHFTVEEYIRANCEYPGQWAGKVQRVEQICDLYITVTHVYALDQKVSFHVTSFIKRKDDKIVSVDEYWGEDGTAPQWRLDKNIGTPIIE